MHCLYCQRRIFFWTRILNGSFCSAGHRTAYTEEITRVGLTRLLAAQLDNAGAVPADQVAGVEAMCQEAVDAPTPLPMPAPSRGFQVRIRYERSRGCRITVSHANSILRPADSYQDEVIRRLENTPVLAP